MRKRTRLLSAVAAVLLLAVVLVGLRATKPVEKEIAPEESVVREIMQDEPAAAYWFIGGTCRVYPYGEDYLGVLRHDREMDAVEGRVEFGEKLLSAAEYYALYGDLEGGMRYSEAENAYVDEVGNRYASLSVPTHVFPYRCFADGEGMLDVWVMSAADLAVLRDYRGIGKRYDNGDHWGAMLEEIE